MAHVHGGTAARFCCLCIGLALIGVRPLEAQTTPSLKIKQSSGSVDAAPSAPAHPVPPAPPASPRVSSPPRGHAIAQSTASERQGTLDQDARLDALETQVGALRADVARSTEEVRITARSMLELNRKTEQNTVDIIEILKRLEALSRDISNVRAELLALQASVVAPATNPPLLRTGVLPSQVEELTQQVATLRDEMEMVKRELAAMDEQLKELDPGLPGNRNVRRILGSPYLGVTAAILSIAALILAF